MIDRIHAGGKKVPAGCGSQEFHGLGVNLRVLQAGIRQRMGGTRRILYKSATPSSISSRLENQERRGPS